MNEDKFKNLKMHLSRYYLHTSVNDKLFVIRSLRFVYGDCVLSNVYDLSRNVCLNRDSAARRVTEVMELPDKSEAIISHMLVDKDKIDASIMVKHPMPVGEVTFTINLDVSEPC